VAVAPVVPLVRRPRSVPDGAPGVVRVSGGGQGGHRLGASSPSSPRGAIAGAPRIDSTGDSAAAPSGVRSRTPRVIRGEDITPRAVEWLMKDRIPYGFLTIIGQ
jgi:hypothetical protein